MLKNVTAYGAVPDGVTDCTAAIQAAIDDAGKEPAGGAVYIPAGEYVTGRLRMYPHVRIYGEHAWSIRNSGGSILKLCTADMDCLLDVTGCFGCTVTGLVLDGNSLGEHVSGIMFRREDFFDHPEEDTLRIENCQIKNFTGSGIDFQYVCAFSIRGCQVLQNKEHGLALNSWDGFMIDNWFSDNGGWGIHCSDLGVNNAAMTLTGNRIEWNHKGGIYIKNAKLWQMTGNYFDRNGGPGVYIAPGTDITPDMDPRWIKLYCNSITLTGNIFYRNGAEMPVDESCHLYMEECYNITVSCNTFLAGKHDNNEGASAPEYGIVIKRLKGCIISQNSLYGGYTREMILNQGDHGEQVIIEKNAGTSSQEVFL